jgi:hypothetical protein
LRSCEREILSSNGNGAYMKSLKCRILKQHLNVRPNGDEAYFMVGLNKNGVKKSFVVHRLIAFLFVPNPNNLPCVGHLNNIKTDNRAVNLKWMTHQENTVSAHIDGLMPDRKGESNPSSILSNNDVLAIAKQKGKATHKQIGLNFGVSERTVNDIMNGRTWSHLTGI